MSKTNCLILFSVHCYKKLSMYIKALSQVLDCDIYNKQMRKRIQLYLILKCQLFGPLTKTHYIISALTKCHSTGCINLSECSLRHLVVRESSGSESHCITTLHILIFTLRGNNGVLNYYLNNDRPDNSSIDWMKVWYFPFQNCKTCTCVLTKLECLYSFSYCIVKCTKSIFQNVTLIGKSCNTRNYQHKDICSFM